MLSLGFPLFFYKFSVMTRRSKAIAVLSQQGGLFAISMQQHAGLCSDQVRNYLHLKAVSTISSVQKMIQMRERHKPLKTGCNFMCPIFFLGCFKVQWLPLQQSHMDLSPAFCFFPNVLGGIQPHGPGQHLPLTGGCCQAAQSTAVQASTCKTTRQHGDNAEMSVCVFVQVQSML